MAEEEPRPFGRTWRTPSEIAGDAAAAERFWAGLEHLSPSRRARILSEGQYDGHDKRRPPRHEVAKDALESDRHVDLQSRAERQRWIEVMRRPIAERIGLRGRRRYVRGEIHPAGLSYERALEIAIAATELSDASSVAASSRHPATRDIDVPRL